MYYIAHGTVCLSVFQCLSLTACAVLLQMFGKVEVPKEAFVCAIAINTDT